MSMQLGVCLLGNFLLAAGAVSAAEESAASSSAGKPAYKIVVSENLASSASPAWRLNHGSWKIVDGAWQGAELAADMHPAVARYPLDFTDAVIQFDFKFDGAKMVQLFMNDSKTHVCRVQIRPTQFRLLKEDRDGPKGPDKLVVLASKDLELKPGTWYHARLELTGPEFTAQIGDVLGGGKHERIAAPKASFAFAVNGEAGSFRNLRVSVPAK